MFAEQVSLWVGEAIPAKAEDGVTLTFYLWCQALSYQGPSSATGRGGLEDSLQSSLVFSYTLRHASVGGQRQGCREEKRFKHGGLRHKKGMHAQAEANHGTAKVSKKG